PNKDFAITAISPPSNQPRQKAYLDFNTGWPDNSWEITEPAIYYQAAYLRLLAAFVDASTSPPTSVSPEQISNILVYPNPSQSLVKIQHDLDRPSLVLMDLNGRQLIQREAVEQQLVLDLAHLPKGVYILQINSKEGQRLDTRKVVLK
ncbi:MAG: T9SS type A sorting domain-containing protein, partial [Bacteroidota bacterium]